MREQKEREVQILPRQPHQSHPSTNASHQSSHSVSFLQSYWQQHPDPKWMNKEGNDCKMVVHNFENQLQSFHLFSVLTNIRLYREPQVLFHIHTGPCMCEEDNCLGIVISGRSSPFSHCPPSHSPHLSQPINVVFQP